MTNIDLAGYNLSELKGLQYDIEKEIKNRKHQDLQKARGKILAIAQDAGVSVEELLAAGQKKLKKEKVKRFKRVTRIPMTTRKPGRGVAVSQNGLQQV